MTREANGVQISVTYTHNSDLYISFMLPQVKAVYGQNISKGMLSFSVVESEECYANGKNFRKMGKIQGNETKVLLNHIEVNALRNFCQILRENMSTKNPVPPSSQT